MPPEFTIVTESGTRYGADNIHAARDGNQPVVSFICSGEIMTLPAGEIDHIEVDAGGGDTLCMTCLRQGEPVA